MDRIVDNGDIFGSFDWLQVPFYVIGIVAFEQLKVS
jgi:hypothetical protein